MTVKENWSMDEIAENIKNTLEVDKDAIIIVDGETGAGKSTLAIKLCKKACPWFEMERDIIYSQNELVDKITNAKNGSAFLADEAVNLLFKRDFASKKQKFILRLLDMCRSKNLLLMMCVPNFWSLDKHLLEGRARMRIHVARTGLAFMWKPTKNPFTPDKWCRRYNEKVCTNWDSYPNARRTKGFIGYIKFGDLGVHEKEIYVAIKEKKKAEVKAQEEVEEQEKSTIIKRATEMGKTMMLVMLQERAMLKMGAIKTIATLEGVTANAIGNRMADFRKRGIVLEEPSQFPHPNTLYNNSTKQKPLMED